jgi:3-dehydroquinate synthase
VPTVKVQLEPRPYDVVIEAGLLARAGERVLAALGGPPTSCFVVTAAPVRKRWGKALAASLAKAGLEPVFLEMPDGERAKTMATVERLAAQLVKHGADRQSALIALGGGVVGDVTGFVAAIYMRGIAVVQVPTTLLAQVDAAIGGKTGVNLPAGKNLLGSFHQPRAVLADPAVLSTLPPREYRAGLFEALKCGIIRNPAIFEFMDKERARILKRDPAALEWLIAACAAVKAEVVAADEREGGLRRILNFGHTLGHALEAEGGYRRFLHGEAVGWGMVAAAMLAVANLRLDSETASRILSAVLAYGPLPPIQAPSARILRRLHADKKTVRGAVHFVLPRALGEVEVVSGVPESQLRQVVEQVRALSRVKR